MILWAQVNDINQSFNWPIKKKLVYFCKTYVECSVQCFLSLGFPPLFFQRFVQIWIHVKERLCAIVNGMKRSTHK